MTVDQQWVADHVGVSIEMNGDLWEVVAVGRQGHALLRSTDGRQRRVVPAAVLCRQWVGQQLGRLFEDEGGGS